MRSSWRGGSDRSSSRPQPPPSSRSTSRATRALAGWLEGVGLSPARRQDAVLAVSEAAANAAEHAYGFDGAGIVDVEAWVADGELHLSVQDTGTWRVPIPDVDRGRGRTMMRALMGVVTIEPGEDGTTVRMSLPIRHEVPA